MKSFKLITLVFLCSLSVATQASKKTEAAFPEAVALNIVSDYSKHVYNTYVELLKANKNLENTLQDFTKNPTQESFDRAKTSWLEARRVYAATEAFRFYGGPIDDATTGPEGLMNAWPLDEAYIDYVKGDDRAGIINNPKQFPSISKELIISMNEKNGEKNISSGYHAIEFLLWGQDFDLKSPGKRSFEDYIKLKNANAERRASYLNLLSLLLVEHSQQLVDAWDINKKGAFVHSFTKLPLKDSLNKIFLGVGTLAMDEMSGERMIVPLEKNDQENEQNCFSDTTDKDLLKNQEGIMAIYLGKYQGFDGVGLKAFISSIDKKGEQKIQAQLDKSLNLLKNLKSPFDNVIMEKKNGAQKKLANKIIDSLQMQSKLLAKSIASVGMDINIEQ